MTALPAVAGGTPVRRRPLPTVDDRSGRDLGRAELALLKEVVASGRLFRYGGTKVRELEKRFAACVGARFAVAASSGTAAIHAALAATGIEPGAEVITTPITDMGTVIPIVAQQAVPVFADVDPETFNLDPADVERKITARTRAIIAVHILGRPCAIDRIMALARRRRIPVIEDCAEALLAEDRGRKVGTIGALGAFSFQQSKHMTTGDGGIAVTNDEALARKAAFFTDKGWDRSVGGPRSYVSFGFNYRMNELTGAVALAQLGKLRRTVARRRRVARWLTRDLQGVAGVRVPLVPPGVKHSYWFYPIAVDPGRLGVSNEQFARAVGAEGVGAGTWIGKPLYLGRVFAERRRYGGREVRYGPGLCPRAEEVARRLVVLGCNERFTRRDAADTARAVRKVAAYYAARR